MRELKFRVWEPLNKKMHQVEYCLYENTNQGKRFILPTDNQSTKDSYTVMNLDAVIVMQFTGLKDKNGVEIFEGDIVFIKYFDEHGGVECEKVPVTCSEKGLGYYPFNWETSCDNCDCSLEIGSVEVIGNIHQNPNLLAEGGEWDG